MPSTYTSSGIELLADGEQSGLWGQTTNTNLEIINRMIAEAGSISLSGTTHTLTISDGILSDGQYAALVFGGSPSGTNTVTISPNDAKRIFFVINSSGQSVVLTQGSGGNVTILNGDSKIVYTDGAGASAKVTDITDNFAMGSVNIDGGTIDGTTIGGSTPAAISGTTITATGDVDIADKIVHTGDTNTAIRFPAADTVTVETAGTESLRINSSQYVGIGTTSTLGGSKLGVLEGIVAFNNGAGTPYLQVYNSNAGTDQKTWRIGGLSGGDIRFETVNDAYTSATSRMAIDSSGNVGIGTSSPAYRLDVVSNSATWEIARIKNTGVGQGAFIRFEHDNSPASGYDIGAFGGVDAFVFRRNTTETMRIDSSGNVGIGTSSPAAALEVNGDALTSWAAASTKFIGSKFSTTYDLGMYMDTDNRKLTLSAKAGDSTGTIAFQTGVTPTERMRIDSSGNVGIGTSSPLSRLVVAEGTGQHGFEVQPGTLTYVFAYDRATADYGDLDIAGQTLRFSTDNGSERMRITQSGEFLIGTTSNNTNADNGFKFYPNGSASGAFASFVNAGNGGTNMYVVNANASTTSWNAVTFLKQTTVVGSISCTASSTAYNTSSDYRLKEDVQPMVGASDRLMALKPVNFAWKVDGSRVDGFIAHEAQEVVPQAVTGEKDGEEMQAIDHSKLVPLLTAALQEALTKIEALEVRLNALEGQ